MYLAPEMFFAKEYSYEVDIWSLGIILYGMSYNSFPFSDTNWKNLAAQIAYKEPFYGSGPSKETVHTIQDCLTKDPSRRPTAYDLTLTQWCSTYPNQEILTLDFSKKHKWLVGNNFATPHLRIQNKYRIVEEIAYLSKEAGIARAFALPILKKHHTITHPPLMKLQEGKTRKTFHNASRTIRIVRPIPVP